MKLANLDGRAVIVTAAGAIDVAEASGRRFGPALRSVYEEWDEFLAVAPSLKGEAVSIDEARLGPPSPDPRQVFGIGLNYRDHAAEASMQLPEMPATFTKFPSCITGPYADVEVAGETVDWEVELVVIIGREAHRVGKADAWSHVAGLTIGQDLSERTVQMAAGRQFCLGKSFPGFGPTGPWLVTPDEVADKDDLALGCSVDGETVQDARTKDLIFPVDELIVQLSAVVTLYPGDIIFTGTPSGVGMARKPPRFLAPGHVLETWIEGLGHMRNVMQPKKS
jgi:2-keto-4-pentenoate hydratase/2-oxohepta-3-ene-1,7-dioic acid hydratase in catechol pathway